MASADWGMDPTADASGHKIVHVVIEIAGKAYAATIQTSYTARANVGGKFKY